MSAKGSKQVADAVADAGSDSVKALAKQAKENPKKREYKSLDDLFPRRMRVGSRSEVEEVIPTGLEVLDRYVLGCGGWPVRRVVEVFSDPSAGKSSLGFAALASAQREGGIAILIETENSLQVARATVFGVNLDEVYLSEPQTLEEVLEGMKAGLRLIPANAGPNLMLWDSIADSKAREDKKGIGKAASLMSEDMTRIASLAATKRTAIVLINQARQKIGIVFGDPTTTPGGTAHKFQSSIRLQLWAGKAAESAGEIVGIHTTVKAVKNKLAIPFHKAKVRLLFETGWDDRWSTIAHAKEMGLIPEAAKVGAATLELARQKLGWT